MIKVNGRLVICSGCSGTHVWKKGNTPSRYGLRQRYICFDCGASFYPAQEIVAWPPKKTKRVKSLTRNALTRNDE